MAKLVWTLMVIAVIQAASLNTVIAQATPFAATQPATSISSTDATLNGMAAPNGLPSQAWFEWGGRGDYGQQTDPVTMGDGFSVLRVSHAINGLTNQGIYQFRLVISNAMSVTFGAKQFFTTGRRLVGWNSSGQLGLFPNAPSNAVAVARGGATALAITSENATAVQWTWNGTTASVTNVAPQPVLTNVQMIAAGDNFQLALLFDGTVTAWGDNSSGQINVPQGLTNVVFISAGPRYGMALKDDGTVSAWGQYSWPIPFPPVSVPAGLSNIVSLAGGFAHCAALKADGTVQVWGDNYFGQLGVPPWLSNVTAIAAGPYFTLALRSDGTVVKWPGTHPSVPPFSPPKIVGSNAVAITSDLALSKDGTVFGLDNPTAIPIGLSNIVATTGSSSPSYALGPNLPPTGQTGHFRTTANTSIIVQLDAADPNGDALQYRIISLPNAGTLYQYDAGNPGLAITAINTVVTDSGGRLFFVPAIDDFGEPYATFDFVGSDGEWDSLPAAITITVIGKPYSVTQPATVGGNSALLHGMVVPNGLPTTVWFEWGMKGSFSQSTTPQSAGAGSSILRVNQPVGSLLSGVVYQCRFIASNSAAVVFGAPRLFGFSGKGKVVAWGANQYGQTSIPPGTTNVVAISGGGGHHSLALKMDGSVLGWGWNTYGQASVPPGLNNVVAIGTGDYHSLALRDDGTVVAWGRNNFGQTNVPVGLTNVIAVTGGGDQSLALKADGTVVAWGANDSGQATVPPGLSNVVALAGGGRHSLALLADGTLSGWGNNAFGKASNPAGLSNAVAVAAAGGDHNIALRTDTTVLAWGFNNLGSTSVPSGLTNALAVGAGIFNGYAVHTDGSLTSWGNNTSGQRNPPAGLTNVWALGGGATHVIALADNLAPTAAAQAFSGYPNHDLIIQLAGSDRNGDSLSYRISSLPGAGTLYQFSAGNRGPAITNPDTIVSDSSARLLFAPAANTLGSPYSTFTFVSNDGEADSIPATVTVNVIIPSAPQLNAAGVVWLPGTGLQLNFSGNSNATYRLWASSNLTDWIPLPAATPTSNGWFQFIDSDATNIPQRFYRAGAP